MYTNQRDYEKSSVYYKKCVEMKGVSGYVHASYGYLLYLMKEYDEARKYLNLALVENKKKNCDLCWAYCYYGLLEYDQGNMDLSNHWLNEYGKLCDSSDVEHLDVIKTQDPKNTLYFVKCKQLATKPK